MKPVKQSHTTRILFAPSGWDCDKHGQCIGLPVTDSEGVMYSYWRTSWRQRLQILFGQPIRLCVVGFGHPPVALDTED